MHHLDGVNYHQRRVLFLGNQADLLDAGFRQHIKIVSRQAKGMSAHCLLMQRLFAGAIQRFDLLRQFAQRLQQQRGCPRTRVTANQYGASLLHAAA